ncbi:ATP-dependent DNA ligase [Cytobacillus sp. FJAT-54145]|uniref:ATP-dependent DNA ligase n=1 Tax=Cytobacillus spartinae TaxID=3299023 RepID=A0ABW6KI65_9BACI
MLLSKSDPFSSPDFIFEWKSDGIRMELIHEKTKGISCYTRHKTNCTKQFIELQDLKFDEDLILDGELICYDPELKKEDLELVMKRFKLTSSEKIAIAATELPCTYVVFDILYYKKPLMNLPLMDRKHILEQVVSPSEYVQQVMYLDTYGENFFESIKELSLEGCVAKRKNSLYYPSKRSDDWKKIIRYEHYQVVITGKRKKEFGFLCSYVTNSGLKPAGVIEFATKEQRVEVYQKGVVDREDNLNEYYKHAIPCTVKTRGKTRAGYLRTPIITQVH